MIYRIWRRLLTWFGDIYFATRPPKVKAEHIRQLLAEGRAGDVICRKYTYYLDSYFIPGEYSHSGIIVDDQQMVHAVAEGVERIDVIDFVKDCDGFILLRPRYKHGLDVYEAFNFAREQVGKDYDFLFDSRDKSAFYCHELTAAALDAGGVYIDKYTLGFCNGVILASDIIAACDVVYEMGKDGVR